MTRTSKSIIFTMVMVFLLASTSSVHAGDIYEVSQKALQVWERSGTVLAHAAVEITNTSNRSINITDLQLAILDSEGNVLGLIDMIRAIPDLVPPGETALAGGTVPLSGAQSVSDVSSLEVYASVEPSSYVYKLPSVEKLKPLLNTSWPTISGYIVNNTDVTINNVSIIVGIYDQENKLLGISKGKTNMILQPGKKLPFQTSVTIFEMENKAIFENAIFKVKVQPNEYSVIF